MDWLSGLSLELVIVLCLLVVGAGLLIRYGLKYYQKRQQPAGYRWYNNYELTRKELIVVCVAVLVGILPLTNIVVHYWAQSSAVDGYKEFWNGSITAAKTRAIKCEEDGSCRHTYKCHPWVWYETVNTYDSKGNITGSTQVPHTEYHDCPYTDYEYDYWLEDTLGQQIMIASNIFAAQPRSFEGNAIPRDVPRGEPAQWTAIGAVLARGENPPSTKVGEYTNYLLAASDSLLRAYSDKIDAYREKGLMPDHTRNMKSDPIHDGYKADKVMFVKMDPGADVYNAWQDAIARLNAELGTELQGDLHLLAVPADQIDNPDEYTNALLADWQSRAYGKEALAKNAIMVVVGVNADGKTVKWARAKTGIPEGNGEMIAALSLKLTGVSFTPEAVLGGPKASPDGNNKGKVVFAPTKGVIEQTVLRDHPFMRPCMLCKDPGDHGQGYVYLKDSALLPGWAPWALGSIVFVFALGLFGLMAYIDLDVFMASLAQTVSDLKKQARRKIRRVFERL